MIALGNRQTTFVLISKARQLICSRRRQRMCVLSSWWTSRYFTRLEQTISGRLSNNAMGEKYLSFQGIVYHHGAQ